MKQNVKNVLENLLKKNFTGISLVINFLIFSKLTYILTCFVLLPLFFFGQLPHLYMCSPFEKKNELKMGLCHVG